MLLTERAARLAAESEAKFRALLIEKLKYTIAKLRHERFGQSSERSAILEQLELETFLLGKAAFRRHQQKAGIGLGRDDPMLPGLWRLRLRRT